MQLWHKALGAAAVGGWCIAGGLSYVRYKVRKNMTASEFFQTSLQELRSSNSAKQYLGEPITDGAIDLGDKHNWVMSHKAQLKVPVLGPKRKGVLYLWAQRNAESGKHWNILRLELDIEGIKDKRLLIYSAPGVSIPQLQHFKDDIS